MSNLNDPRVLFAAERTLLAWNRTSLALIAFGFVVERSGLLVRMLSQQQGMAHEGKFAFWAGLGFMVLGVLASIAAVAQYRVVLQDLNPAEIPPGYRVNLGVFINLAVALMGGVLSGYLLLRGPL
jgi:putative membrane protein